MKEVYKLINSKAVVGEFQKDLMSTDVVAMDIETDGLDTFINRIRLVQFEMNDNIYILNVDTHPTYLTYIIELVRDNNVTAIFHNAKFDIKFLLRATGVMLDNVFDTFTAEVVLTAGTVKRNYPPLKQLVELYSNVILQKEIRLEFVESSIITEEMLVYSALDVKYLREIRELQTGTAKNLKLDRVLDLEMKLVPVVARMEYDGVLLDADQWMLLYQQHGRKSRRYKKYIEDYIFTVSWEFVKNHSDNALEAMALYRIPKPKTKKLTKYLTEITDEHFMLKEVRDVININSHLQLRASLNLCGVPVESTGKDKLARYMHHNLVRAILPYRDHTKKIDTFGANWLDNISPITGRIHPKWNQVGTETGRWSSNDPNMQNIVRDPEYRKCFTARPGYKLITADYSQAEMRLMGAISGENEIINAYIDGVDIHALTASFLFEKPVEAVTKSERERGKTINFSIIYGTTAFGIAKANKDLNKKEAQQLLDRFFAGYPRLKQFMSIAGDKIFEKRISKTPLGRIRFFDKKNEFKDTKEFYSFLGRVKREGVNNIIQGCSADALKMAMVDCSIRNPFGHDNFRFLKQIHDEVVVEVKDEIVDESVDFLITAMERAEKTFLGDIPAVVDYDVADYWVK